MATSPEVYNTFTISSGCLCFGGLDDLWNGSSVPPQRGFPDIRPRTKTIPYNMPAKNGTWNAYRLLDGDEVVAWFIAHSDVDPEMEVDKILRVSGSPYEKDFGSKVNNPKTAAEGVFIINRYGWGRDRSLVDEEEFPRVVRENGGMREDPEDESRFGAGILQRPPRPKWFQSGADLHIPRGEYDFGRFGFDDTHTATHSFLFFTTNTVFPSTSFAGLQETIRPDETEDQRVERKVREGFNFSGVESIRALALHISDPPRDMIGMGPDPPPLPSECFGPYDPGEHILRAQDIDALRLSVTRKAFFEPERLGSLDLINELALSFLERTFFRGRTVPAAPETLFPHRDEPRHFDSSCYRHFTQPHADPIANFDSASVCTRIRSFLASRDTSMVFADEYIAGICGVTTYLVSEVVSDASIHASDVCRGYILPCDVRCVVINDNQLRARLQFSKSFWEGRHRELPLPETRSESCVPEEEWLAIRANINYEE